MIQNLGWAALHHGVGRGALFVFFLALPWLMNAEEVGRLTFTYTVLLLLLQPILDTAIGTIIVKYTSRDNRPNVSRAIRFLSTALLVAGVVIAAVTLMIPGHFPVLPLLGAAVLGSISLSAFFAWRRGLEDFRLEGIVGSAHKVLVLVALAILTWVGSTGPAAAASALFAGAVGAWFLTGTFFRRIFQDFRHFIAQDQDDASSTSVLLREGIVLGAIGVAGLLYLRIDVVMLGLLSGDAEVGFYFTAARVLEASFIIPHIIMLVAFPRMARSGDVRALLRKTLTALGLSGILAAVALAAFGRWIVPTFYGAAWARTGEILVLLSFAAPAVFLGYCLTQALVAADLQERYLMIAVIGLTVNVGLNLVLIPKFGGAGAAGATVATEIVVTLGAAVALFSGKLYQESKN